jgi:hypothetical protein
MVRRCPSLLCIAVTIACISTFAGDVDAQDAGQTRTSFFPIGGNTPVGALRVTILPTEIQSAAGWRLTSPRLTSYNRSGYERGSLTPGSNYRVNLLPVSGYSTPSDTTVVILGGQRTDLIVTYERNRVGPTCRNPE